MFYIKVTFQTLKAKLIRWLVKLQLLSWDYERTEAFLELLGVAIEYVIEIEECLNWFDLWAINESIELWYALKEFERKHLLLHQ